MKINISTSCLLKVKKLSLKILFVFVLSTLIFFEVKTKKVSAQDSPSVLYVPLIGITSVPKPLSLPNGAGDVTYNYAVKNFLSEVPLVNIVVSDSKCSSVVFVGGDDNKDSKLDYNETWRYRCTTKVSKTTESAATATGIANNITASHNAYVTVVVGSNNPAPLVSIINITKVAYPLSLPSEGGKITFTYKVNNPGVVPLSDVVVTDNKCNALSGRLGDTNGNNLLDMNEVWIYTCTTTLTETTTNTVNVAAYANGLRAVDNATITVKVDSPEFPDTGAIFNPKTMIWGGLLCILIALIIISGLVKKSGNEKQNKSKTFKKWLGK